MKPITVLWYGAGQDSTAILFKSVYDQGFKQQFIKGDLIVICSDTGNEFPQTYRYINDVVKPFCTEHNIHFAHLTQDKGYHPKTWQSLSFQFERNAGVMSVAFPKTCTDNLKVKPCYNYLEALINERYGFEYSKPKSAFYKYFEAFGKLDVIIGFGADETSRVGLSACNKAPTLFDVEALPAKDYSPVYVQKCINKVYPLVELGLTRKDCQSVISGYEKEVPIPSNCMMCPFANEKEVLYLLKAYPEQYNQWVAYEAAKMSKDAERGKVLNFGVKGTKTLKEFTDAALLKYGHLSLSELEEYRFSHGHCVKSRY